SPTGLKRNCTRGLTSGPRLLNFFGSGFFGAQTSGSRDAVGATSAPPRDNAWGPSGALVQGDKPGCARSDTTGSAEAAARPGSVAPLFRWIAETLTWLVRRRSIAI